MRVCRKTSLVQNNEFIHSFSERNVLEMTKQKHSILMKNTSPSESQKIPSSKESFL